MTCTCTCCCGACCYPDGNCLVLTEAECLESTGEWQGKGTTCTPNPCVCSGPCGGDEDPPCPEGCTCVSRPSEIGSLLPGATAEDACDGACPDDERCTATPSGVPNLWNVTCSKCEDDSYGGSSYTRLDNGTVLIDPPSGPGTELKKLLMLIGIKATPNCTCNQRAKAMDERGCDWCEENIETICDWLKEEADKRGLLFLRSAAKLMVRRAIHNARAVASKE